MCLVGPNMWDTCAMGATTVWDTRRLGLTTKMKMFSYHNTICTMNIVHIGREISFFVFGYVWKRSVMLLMMMTLINVRPPDNRER